jgi:hypothetical protein
MFIKTNFGSGRQVYENVKQLNQLANVDQDTVELGRILKISPSQAADLKGFYITSNTDRNTIAEIYAEYYQNLDSVSQTEATFESYKEFLADHEPESNGTNLYMGDSDSNKSAINEGELLKKQLELQEEKREAMKKLVEERDVISVISGFPSSGYDIREWTDKKYYTFPLALFALTLFIFILIGLGQFLKERGESRY